ncbi:MAG: BatD family protein [candidate division Zixibacteria bacterium]
MVKRDFIYRAIIITLTVIFCIIPDIAFAAEDIKLEISLSRDKIGQEEKATLSIKVITSKQLNLPDPKLPPLPMFDISPSGKSSMFNQSNNEINITLTYNFVLSPKRTGKFPIRSAWLVYGNERYESNELAIEVVGSAREASGPLGNQSVDSQGRQREVFMTAEVDKTGAYVDEQITLSIKFYRQSRISNPQAKYDTPSVTDFWPIVIPPQRTYNQILNGKEYSVVELRQALFPTKPGKLTIGPARITALVPERQSRRSRDPFSLFDNFFQPTKRVQIKSNPITVTVKPLPSAGKSGEFSGAVGDYRISASVDKPEVEVNEAIALTVKIAGRGNTRSIPEPRFPSMDNFRFEKSSSDLKPANIGNEIGGTKTFEYLLIPKLPGMQTIEPLELTFFDPEKGRYRVARTSPIAFNVKQGELTAGTDIPYNPVAGQIINLQATDIRHIKTENGSLYPVGSVILTSPYFLTAVALPALVLLGGLVDVRRRRKLQGDIAYARSRRAKSAVKKRLKAAEGCLSKNEDEFFAELSGAVYQYVGDKLNISEYGLTSESLEELLIENGIAENIRSEIREVLKEADFGRFAGSSIDKMARKNLFDRAGKAILKLEDEL